MAYGLGGGEAAGYPRGVVRAKLVNVDTTAGNWAGVWLQAYVERDAD